MSNQIYVLLQSYDLTAGGGIILGKSVQEPIWGGICLAVISWGAITQGVIDLEPKDDLENVPRVIV